MFADLKSRLAKIARITSKIAGAFIAFVLLLGLVWAVINSFDAPLSDQAKALLAAPPNPYSADQNIYLAMAGLEGAEERPIIEMGEKRIAGYNQALDSMLLHPDTAPDRETMWNASKLAFNGKLEIAAPRTGSIWSGAKSHRQDIAAALAANQRLYQRYLSLHHLQGYYETARPSFMAPFIVLPQQLRALFLAEVANRIQTGSSQQQREALNDIERDLELWRTVLKGDGTLRSKMLAIAWLHGDLILLGDLITDPSIDLKALNELFDPILVPWDLKDYRIGNAFAAEYRARATLYGTIGAANELVGASASSSWPNRFSNALQAHFFKPNATENMDAVVAARRIELGDSEPNEFERNRQAYEDWLERDGPHLSPSYVYNPMGKILVTLSAAQKDSYSSRAFDVAAYQRLVYLVLQLKRQHIATPDIESFLKVHPDWSTHPVDRKPFGWNPEAAELTVTTLGEHPKGQRFSVILH